VCEREEQIVAYRTAIQRNPSDYMSWHHLGNALVNGENREEAIQCFAIAVEGGNDSSAAWLFCDLIRLSHQTLRLRV
jgi:cytochrome c-type biogenesis protein CcmH/NrfG